MVLCGTANGVNYSQAPTANLCTIGSPEHCYRDRPLVLGLPRSERRFDGKLFCGTGGRDRLSQHRFRSHLDSNENRGRAEYRGQAIIGFTHLCQ